MITIEPLGTGVILPAIMLGYELTEDFDPQATKAEAIVPNDGPIVAVAQQAGGYCMRYPWVVGSLLRLEANDGMGKQPLRELIRGLKAMAEDPDIHVLQNFPLLRELVWTRGDPYTRDELSRLEHYLGQFFAVPPIDSGIEAFIRFAPCNPLDLFSGWRVMNCKDTLETGAPATASPDHGRYLCDSYVHDLIRSDDVVLDETLIRRLNDLGHELGFSQPLTTFLLWENSD